jgi:hypothetical protein
VNDLLVRTAIQRSNGTRRLRINWCLARLIFFPLSILLAWVAGLSQAHAQGKMSPMPKGLGKEFASETARVNGITVHYVRGGEGPAVLLWSMGSLRTGSNIMQSCLVWRNSSR